MHSVGDTIWPKTPNAVRYKLFAERCAELVNPKSHDSYRVHALSTPLKLAELLVNSQKVIDRQFPKASIGSIVDEVNEAIKSDLVVKKILSDLKLDVSVITPLITETTEEINSRTKLAQRLVKKEYRRTCEEMIIQCCETEGGKSELLVLTKLYISFLIGSGFHRGWVEQSVKELFCKDRVKQCSRYLLMGFFDKFHRDGGGDFTILLIGSSRYINFLSGVFSIPAYSNIESLPPKVKIIEPEKIGLPADKKILVLTQYKARDPYSAVKGVESFLTLPRSFLFIYPSGLREALEDECIVIEGKTSKLHKISRKSTVSSLPSKSSMIKSASKSVKSFAEYALASEVMSDRKTMGMMLRSLNSASLAANSSDSETQLITLWSAFEALLPAPSKDDGKHVRIVHFNKLIVPCVARKYLLSKFQNCFSVCAASVGGSFQKVLDDHGAGASPAERLGSILIGEPAYQKMLMKSLADSPLLMNRVWSLQRVLLNPKDGLGKTTTHESRVSWQVNRIYRERNDIVHSGSRSPFIAPLVENAFLYYRLVIRSLEDAFTRYNVYEPHSALQLISGQHSDAKDAIGQMLSNHKLNDEQKQLAFFKFVFQDQA
ncbi:hypothetical protein [Yoonia sp.]|uniref:hypothetical protein n=1 Tax=Yoonia sp. TaxID=2212373 RepID=UPI003F72FCFB